MSLRSLRIPTFTFDSVSSLTSRTFLPAMPPWLLMRAMTALAVLSYQ